MNQIWYNKETFLLNESLPVGNGRLGAFVYGSPDHEILTLTEESVWSSPYRNRNNKYCPDNLDKIRSLLKIGKTEEAQSLVMQSMGGLPEDVSLYQTAGQVHIDYFTDLIRGVKGSDLHKENPYDSILNYRRSLDLNTAVVTTSFSTQSAMPSNADFAGYQKGSSITYNREVFISSKSDVITVHISASTPKSIYLRLSYTDKDKISLVTNLNEEDTLAFTSTKGVPFACVMHVVSSGGSVTLCGEYINVEGADDVTVYIDIETAYTNTHFRNRGGNVARLYSSYAYECMDKALRKVCFAQGQSYIDLKKDHIKEYEDAFNTARLDLTSGDSMAQSMDNIPTDEIIKQYPYSPYVSELYWKFGRYLLLSYSRTPGKLPINIADNSFYSVNSALQMSYWPACMTGLADCENSLFHIIKKAYKKGVVTARTMYRSRGWVCHNALDIWGDTAPCQNRLDESFWPLGAAWLCTHIWEHYQYTQDKKFLKKYYYLMEDVCMFFADYMVTSIDGKYRVVNPSLSPKNEKSSGLFISEGCDMDNRIIEHIIDSTVSASHILKKDSHNAVITSLKELRRKIEEIKVTEDGKIRQWTSKEQYSTESNSSIAFLYGLYPGHTVDYYRTPLLTKAAKLTIKDYDRHIKNQSLQDIVLEANLKVSLHQADEVKKTLENVFKNYTSSNLMAYDFKTECNLGLTACITRCIVKSFIFDGKVDIDVLPCPLDSWMNGSLQGVCLKGNLKMEIEWHDLLLTKARVYSIPGSVYLEEVIIHYKDRSYETRLLDGRLDLLNVITDL